MKNLEKLSVESEIFSEKVEATAFRWGVVLSDQLKMFNANELKTWLFYVGPNLFNKSINENLYSGILVRFYESGFWCFPKNTSLTPGDISMSS